MSSSITSRYSITSSGGTRLLATSARLSLRKQPDRGSQHERSGRTETVYESGSTPPHEDLRQLQLHLQGRRLAADEDLPRWHDDLRLRLLRQPAARHPAECNQHRLRR